VVSKRNAHPTGALLFPNTATGRQRAVDVPFGSPISTTVFWPSRFMTPAPTQRGSSTATTLPRSLKQSIKPSKVKQTKPQTSSSVQGAEYFQILDQPTLDVSHHYQGLGLWYVNAQSMTNDRTKPIKIYCYSHQVDNVTDLWLTAVQKDVEFELDNVPCNNGFLTEFIFPYCPED